MCGMQCQHIDKIREGFNTHLLSYHQAYFHCFAHGERICMHNGMSVVPTSEWSVLLPYRWLSRRVLLLCSSTSLPPCFESLFFNCASYSSRPDFTKINYLISLYIPTYA